MKKSMLYGGLLMLVAFPAFLYAQEVQLPTQEIRASQDLLPAKVKDAVLNDFGLDHKPLVWVNNSTVFDTYEWTQIANPKIMDINTYGIHSKTSNGSTLDAVYTADGRLINSREYLVNFRPEQNILLALQITNYRDWSIMKDFRLIKTSSNGIGKQRYALVMNKGNKKETVYLDPNGSILAERRGDHGELADLDF